MTTPTTVTPDPRHGTDPTRDDRTGTHGGSTSGRGPAAPTAVPATGGPADPAPRSAPAKALVGLAAASAVLGLGLLLPAALAVLAVLAALVAIGSIALVVSSPWWLFVAAGAAGALILVMRRRTRSRPAQR
jgi:hypothetical protein